MTDNGETNVPWRDGFWKMGPFNALILQTSGHNKLLWKNLVALDYPDIEAGSFAINCKFGNFGEAREEIAKATGEKFYNFHASNVMLNCKGVMNSEGTKITIWGISNTMEEWVWLNETMLQELKDDRDPFEAPECPHIKAQPDKRGKIFWLSGPPGAGKSTTCQLMAREKGYIYYEADCTGSLINPFTDIYADNPSMASFSSKPLKNVPRETANALLSAAKNMDEFFNGNMSMEAFEETVQPYYKAMAEDITRQKKRLGGSFAVAHAVATVKSRDFIRSHMGPELVFIVLNMTQECQKERLKQRHGDTVGDAMINMFKMYEPAKEAEKNTYNVTIEQGMSKEDVMEEVLKIVTSA